jgi:hypothetical protein
MPQPPLAWVTVAVRVAAVPVTNERDGATEKLMLLALAGGAR